MPVLQYKKVKLRKVCFAFLPCRVLLSIMYLMVETIRVQTEDDRPEWRAAREAFKNELGVCVCAKHLCLNMNDFCLVLYNRDDRKVGIFCEISN